MRGQILFWPLKVLNFGFNLTDAHPGAPTVGARFSTVGVKILRCFNPGYRRAAAKKRTPHRGGYVFGRARPAQLIRGALPPRAKDESWLNRTAAG